jgi:dTDP-4-dehydrorhamnose reductase
MRLLVTGGTGQVGKALQRAKGPHSLLLPTHAELPIEDAGAVAALVAAQRPDWIVHTAAMTDVDACERAPEQARAVNALGSENLARAAAAHGCRMLLVSTDYVFDGVRGRYTEHDLTNPINAYGRSKREGELLAEAALPSLCVARTSVVFSPTRNNFVLSVAAALRQGRPVRAAHDQWVTPTSSDDLAQQVLALIGAGASGVYHTAGGERLSRLDMAHRIAGHYGLDPRLIQAISMADLPWVAPRPHDSSLETAKVAALRKPLGFDAALDTLEALA